MGLGSGSRGGLGCGGHWKLWCRTCTDLETGCRGLWCAKLVDGFAPVSKRTVHRFESAIGVADHAGHHADQSPAERLALHESSRVVRQAYCGAMTVIRIGDALPILTSGIVLPAGSCDALLTFDAEMSPGAASASQCDFYRYGQSFDRYRYGPQTDRVVGNSSGR